MKPSSSLLLSMKLQVSPLQCTSNSADGGLLEAGACTSTARVLVSVAPSSSVTRSRTSYRPAAANVCEGFRSVGAAPSSNSQRQATTLPSSSVLRSLNVQLSTRQVNSNSASGGSLAGDGGGGACPATAIAEKVAVGRASPSPATLASPVWTPTMSPRVTTASARPSASVSAVEGVASPPSPAAV